MESLIKNLNCLLSDLNVFYRKVQNYHWNIIGKDFFVIHAKLEEYYDEINEQIDEILVLDVKEHEYFSSQGVSDEHAGLGLFAYDEDVMSWVFNKRK